MEEDTDPDLGPRKNKWRENILEFIFLKTIQVILDGKTICKYNCPETLVLQYFLSPILGDRYENTKIVTLFKKYKNWRSATTNPISQPEQDKLYKIRKEIL